jgi:hypothetical protein
MTIYWLAIAQIVFDRCTDDKVSWNSLDLVSKIAWVTVVRQTAYVLDPIASS